MVLNMLTQYLAVGIDGNANITQLNNILSRRGVQYTLVCPLTTYLLIVKGSHSLILYFGFGIIRLAFTSGPVTCGLLAFAVSTLEYRTINPLITTLVSSQWRSLW